MVEVLPAVFRVRKGVAVGCLDAPGAGQPLATAVAMRSRPRMPFDLQPTLANDTVRLEPLRAGDFEALYAVASDPLIWEQHPSKTRWQRDVFTTYFEGAMQSGGALRVLDVSGGAKTGELVGSSRYYDLVEPTATDAGSVAIGYTFIARSRWGGPFNRALKQLMLDHAFRPARGAGVGKAIFHVGAENHRSRAAMTKLGGVLVGEIDVAYHGERSNPNVVFEITRDAWTARSRVG